MGLPPLRPERNAYTNSATTAMYTSIAHPRRNFQRREHKCYTCSMRKSSLKILGAALGVIAVALGAFMLAHVVENSETARSLVEQFGYGGIFLVSLAAGFNLLVPVPAATLAPVYAAAGFPLPAIVAVISLGTAVADTLGYLIGVGGRDLARRANPRIQQWMRGFAVAHHALVVPFVFLFAALVPVPNEIILVPLAFMGIRFRTLFIPLLLGTILFNTLLVYGLTGAFLYAL